MLMMIIGWLHGSGFRLPYVFSYYSTRMLLAATTSLLLSILFGPRFIKKLYELKIGQTIRTDECPLLGQLHEKKADTPTMGGLLILFSIFASLFLWMDWSHPFTLLLAGTALFLGLLGGADDFLKLKYKNTKGLSGRWKLSGQLLFSLFVASYLLYPPLSEAIQSRAGLIVPVIKEQEAKAASEPSLSRGSGSFSDGKTLSLQEYASRFYIPFMKGAALQLSGVGLLFALIAIAFVITGSSNAVNLTDGLDGLAAGNLIMVSVCFALIAFVSNNIDLAGYLNILYIEGSGEVAIFLSAVIGASLGFLWYNGHPAQVFMGDTGSLALGGALGVSAVLLKRELLLAIVGGVFVAETLSVIIQVASYRLRDKKRVFLCAPLHHHFEYKGWPETKVVLRFWIVGFLLAIIGLASLKFQ